MIVMAYGTDTLDAMVMPEIGNMLVPVAAGPTRGPRFARLLQKPANRVATRFIAVKPAHRLDTPPVSTNKRRGGSSSVTVNVYARTRLKLSLVPGTLRAAGKPFEATIHADLVNGSINTFRTFGRLVAPAKDLRPLFARETERNKRQPAGLREDNALDTGTILAKLERRDPSIARVRDEEVRVVSHHDGPLHLHLEETKVPGVHHLGVWVEGEYRPDVPPTPTGHDHSAAPRSGAGAGPGERFTRLLTLSTALSRSPAPDRRAAARPAARTRTASKRAPKKPAPTGRKTRR
jgi:hypothetical protein